MSGCVLLLYTDQGEQAVHCEVQRTREDVLFAINVTGLLMQLCSGTLMDVFGVMRGVPL